MKVGNELELGLAWECGWAWHGMLRDRMKYNIMKSRSDAWDGMEIELDV